MIKDQFPSAFHYLPSFKPEKISIDQIIDPNLRIFLRCSICLFVFNNPVTLSCGHSFCYDCIKSWHEVEPTCPLCKDDIPNMHMLKKSIVIGDLLENLTLFCQGECCRERLKLKDFYSHWQQCPSVLGECKCGARIQRSKFLESDTECKCPFVTCEFCFVKYQARLINYHSDICKRERVKCPRCSQFYIREAVHEHRNYHCMVKCPYRFYGCKAGLMSQKKIQKHIQESSKEHKQLVKRYLMANVLRRVNNITWTLDNKY